MKCIFSGTFVSVCGGGGCEEIIYHFSSKLETISVEASTYLHGAHIPTLTK